jgi:hypothetical protein
MIPLATVLTGSFPIYHLNKHSKPLKHKKKDYRDRNYQYSFKKQKS